MAIDSTLRQTAEQQRAALERSLDRVEPPGKVPGYIPERFLGSGAYGQVWVALEVNTRRRVAIKYYSHRGGVDWSLLSREVENLAFLSADRYVVQLLDVGWDAEPPYYIMEYLEHGSLADRLREGPMPVDEAINVFRDVTIGLVHAHGKGVLHCDLKPANVLLDQDFRPRLADFGQSRLSHEQSPALGTLFFMAPEQANLQATPDARWDVYALGALLYTLLVGTPPYRTNSASERVSRAEGIEAQLDEYTAVLHESPRPLEHRLLPGVDRELADIIDRCLALDPQRRYPNPQAVLDALDMRAARRRRRPLLLLGALGPALLLAVLAVYSWNVSATAVSESEHALMERALEAGRFAARFVAESVAAQIDQRWYSLEQEANDPDFIAMLKEATGKSRDTPERQQLQARLDEIQKQYPEFGPGNWFLCDIQGNHVARSPFDLRMVDSNFAHRDYFHGQQRDLPRGTEGIEPIQHPHRSHVFVSQPSMQRSIAFSVPVWSGSVNSPDRHVIGVLGMTIDLGDFAALRTDSEPEHGHVAVLVDTREDDGQPPRRGVLLEHPWLTRQRQIGKRPEAVYLSPPDIARLEELRQLHVVPHHREGTVSERTLASWDRYYDPVGHEYEGRWLAAAEPVIISSRPNEQRDTGLTVLVQERFAEAIRPAQQLGHRLIWTGVGALAFVLVLISALWLVVVFVLNESPTVRAVRRRHQAPVIVQESSRSNG